jgi:hypothetical protein
VSARNTEIFGGDFFTNPAQKLEFRRERKIFYLAISNKIVLKRRQFKGYVNLRATQLFALLAALVVTACVSQATQFRRVPGVRDSALAIALDPPIPPDGDVAAYEAATAASLKLTAEEIGLPAGLTPAMLFAMQSGGTLPAEPMVDPAAPPPPGAPPVAQPAPIPNLANRFQSFLPGQPAASQLFRSRSSIDNLRASICLTTAIYYEAASESDDGQRAVAQVVLNRMRHPAYPNTVCGVVFQGTERGDRLCQFSFACDGSMRRTPGRDAWARARRIAEDALAGRVFAPVGYATHYHTLAVNPFWGPKLVKAAIIGAHIFYRMPSVAGMPASFRDSYRGGEPAPSPRIPPERQIPLPQFTAIPPYQMPLGAQTAALANSDPAMPKPPGTLPVPRTPIANIQPEYQRSGDPISSRGGGAAAQPAPRSAGGYAITPESQILPQYRDSGTWIAK